MMPLSLIWNKKKDRDIIVRLLKEKKVLISSTDTVLGLLSDICQESFLALNSIKKRDEKPYLVLIGSYQDAFHFVDEVHLLQIENLLKKCWPGPLTVIFPAKKEIPDYIKSKEGTIALRVPQHEGLLAILPFFNGLFSTSANLSGQPVPSTINEVDPWLLEQIAGVVQNNDQNISQSCQPSTIVSYQDGALKLVREGAFSLKDIRLLCGPFLEVLLDKYK